MLLASGTLGFASFLAYLGHGYLDAWHGVATAALLLCFVVRLVRSRQVSRGLGGLRSLLTPGMEASWRSVEGVGRACLLATAVGMTFAGLTILVVGMTCVFVPRAACVNSALESRERMSCHC